MIKFLTSTWKKKIEILSTFLPQARPLIAAWAQAFYSAVQISVVFITHFITLLQQIEHPLLQSALASYIR